MYVVRGRYAGGVARRVPFSTTSRLSKEEEVHLKPLNFVPTPLVASAS